MRYPGLFNSSYVPSPTEILLMKSPQDFIGPLLLAQIFATLLQGVFLVQYYEYVVGSSDHKRWTRWLVHTTAVLCVLKLVYICWFTWETFVTHYGNWLYLSIFNPLSIPSSLFNTVPSTVCQLFYIQRGWILSKNRYFVAPALLFLVVYLGAGIAQTWSSALSAGGQAVVSNFGLITANVSIISGLLCNFFITGFTCWYLVKEMTGTQKTDNLVKKVIRISIESAAGPTLAALLGLILANLSSQNKWFLLPALVSSHVYACSLLYSVNSKKRLNGMIRNTITSNLYRPTCVRDAEILPTQLITVDGNDLSESSGDQVEISLQRSDVPVDETDKIPVTFKTQCSVTGSSRPVMKAEESTETS